MDQVLRAVHEALDADGGRRGQEHLGGVCLKGCLRRRPRMRHERPDLAQWRGQLRSYRVE